MAKEQRRPTSPTDAATAAGGEVPDRTRWSAVVAVAIMVFMTGLDMTVVAIALPDLSADLGIGPSAAQLLTLAYLVPVIAFMLPAAVWVDRTGRRLAFLVTVAGFGASSAVVAASDALPGMIVARAVQGLFGATVAALSFAVIASVVRPQDRGKAQSLVALLGPLGSVAGPGVGGLLVAAQGWQAAFLINLPICLVAAALAVRSIPAAKPAGIRSGHWARGVAEVSRGRIVRASLGVLLAGATVTGAYNALLPFLLQHAWAQPVALVGVVLLVPPVLMVLTAPLGGALADRRGPRRIQLVGTIILVIGAGMLAATVALADPDGGVGGVLAVVVALVVSGIGAGLILGPNGAILMSATLPHLAGGLGAVAGLARTVGFAFGPALAAVSWHIGGGGAGTVIGLGAVVAVAAGALWAASSIAASPVAAPAVPGGATGTTVQ